jgi:hypothetical protein
VCVVWARGVFFLLLAYFYLWGICVFFWGLFFSGGMCKGCMCMGGTCVSFFFFFFNDSLLIPRIIA